MNRHGLSLVQRTQLTQELSSDLEADIMKFQKYVIDQKKIILLNFPI